MGRTHGATVLRSFATFERLSARGSPCHLAGVELGAAVGIVCQLVRERQCLERVPHQPTQSVVNRRFGRRLECRAPLGRGNAQVASDIIYAPYILPNAAVPGMNWRPILAR
jgi:hypothetical protein